MATAQNIVDQIQVHCRDTGAAEITEAQLLALVNDAAMDAAIRGWMVPIEDDESVTFSAVSVNVPADFAWIREIRYGTNFPSIIPRQYWSVSLNGGVPVIYFDSRLTGVSGTLKFIGWKRPKTTYALVDTIEVGLESFLRERGAHYALTYMAQGTSELDRSRQQTAEVKYRNAEEIIQQRVESADRTSVYAPRTVPGR